MEISSVNISMNDSSPLEADQIMKFTFAELQENQSIIGKTMHEQHVKRFDEGRNRLLSGILHWLSQINDSSLAYSMHNNTMRALYVRLLSSVETSGTDKPRKPQLPSEQENQNGQRLLEKKPSISNKNSPGNPSLPSAILCEIRLKLTFLETTGQRPNIQNCASPSSNFCSG